MAQGDRAGRTVEAEITYFKSSFGKPSFGAVNNAETEKRLMTIHDASSWRDPPTLEREGIALVPFKSAVKDFRNPEEVKKIYGGELAELIKTATGARYAFGFGIAFPRYSQRYAEAPPGGRPAPLAHVDVTPLTAPGIGRNRAYSCEPEVLKPGQQLAGYNVWRVLSEPPHDIPLAVCDQQTVDWDDLFEADGVYGKGESEWRSEAYLVRHNPRHRWIYFSQMKPGDALIFRSYESDEAGYPGVPHAAFSDPSCPENAPGRVSVEARVYVIFDE
ncbi:MAG TPA: CmcJ/NvfI family oxidoreductase [Alphaproteobacteria bacterium]|nr:CmcJ/NvfI family oxidoreductase [Alphaproteobacteria bacterium]